MTDIGLELVKLVGELGTTVAYIVGLLAVAVGVIKAFWGLKLFKLQFMGFVGEIFAVLALILSLVLGVETAGVALIIVLLGFVGGCCVGYKYYKMGMYFYSCMLCGSIFAILMLKFNLGAALLLFIAGFIVGSAIVKKYGDNYIIVVSAVSAYSTWLSFGILLIFEQTELAGNNLVAKFFAFIIAAAGVYWQLTKSKNLVSETFDAVPAETEEAASAETENANEQGAVLPAVKEEKNNKKAATAEYMNGITEKTSAYWNKAKEQVKINMIPTISEKYESIKKNVLEKAAEFKNKFNEDKKFRMIFVSITSVVIVVVPGAFIYINNPLTKFKDAYLEGERTIARANYEEMNESQRNKAEEEVMVQCNETVSYFNNDEISFETAKKYLEYSQYVVCDGSEELRGLVVELYDLKESKDAYEEAGKVLKELQLEDENSENCTELYNKTAGYLSEVADYDTNYDKSVEFLEEAKNAYANNMITIAKQIVTTDDYEVAKNVVNKALEVLPDDANLLAASEFVDTEIAARVEQEKVEQELASLNRLKEKLEDKIEGEVLSPIAPRTLVDSEFVSANLFTIGEEGLWGLMICEDNNCNLYIDDGEQIVSVLGADGAISYSISSEGELMIKVSNEVVYSNYSYERKSTTRTYYAIAGIDDVTSEVFLRRKITDDEEVTRTYYVEETEISEQEFNLREDLYKENAWTDITILVERDVYEVTVNTADAVTAVQAELDALIAERMN